ncbi:MAG: HlyD family efflux transporter periplasmic adaptor subunit [Bryobacterales bacterium]|nr:HlyD family efflux transporter periplasmic adaptor subunit [Bryobacterales bacterium]
MTQSRFQRLLHSRWLRVTGGLLLIAGLAALGAWKAPGWFHQAQQLPTTDVRQGDFAVMVKCRGELVAKQSLQVTAPADVPDLRIVWLVPPGAKVSVGETVLRFDPSSAQRQLREKEAELKQAQATLEEAQAEARIQAEKDARELGQARYEVERARLEVSKAEVVSAVQGEESRISLALAEEKLRVNEATVAFNRASSAANSASLARAREKANDDVALMQYRLSQMEVKAPQGGVIIYLPNYSQGWMNAQPFKVGDQVWPGASVAEIPDLGSLEMEAKIEEIERGRVKEGSTVRIRIDSLPELRVDSRIESISALTQLSFEWPPTSSFRGFAPLASPDARLRPGMNGSMDVVVDTIHGAMVLPAKALFMRDGKPVVYVVSEKGSSARQVEVLGRNADEVAVAGIEAGMAVSLVEPKEREGAS